MALTVARWLEHPSLAPARPRLVAGAGGVANRVRWVHSSDTQASAGTTMNAMMHAVR